MITLTLPGPITSAFAHFALYGLAALCEDSGYAVRINWTASSSPQPHVTVSADSELEVAEVVLHHAQRHCEPTSWVQQHIEHEGRDTAVFSPRIAEPSGPDAWRTLHAARLSTIDTIDTVLDLRMLGGLGEPASWGTSATARGDDGASRWEMKTRNRGEEFVGNRLKPLAESVAARTPGQVLDGLLGRTVVDKLGGANSRTATGLRRPSPTDNALAWCALWAISQFPVIHHITEMSTTPGASVPPRRTHPTSMHLPIFVTPITPARLRTILTSAALRKVATTADDYSPPETAPVPPDLAAQSWLTSHQVPAVIRFPVTVSDNPSAPERQVREGEILSWPPPKAS